VETFSNSYFTKGSSWTHGFVALTDIKLHGLKVT